MSADPAAQLGCLVWLSGQHLASSQIRQSNLSQESVADSLVYETMRGDKAVLVRVTELSKSTAYWIKTQAAFTLQKLNP